MAKAPINGDTLRWARLVGRFSSEELAKAAGVTVERLAAFEDGTEQPTFRQLTMLADKLDRSLGFLFAPPPTTSDVPDSVDFRGHNAELGPPAAVVREMRRAEQRRAATLEFTEPLVTQQILGSIVGESPAKRADSLRSQLQLSPDFVPAEKQPLKVLAFWQNLLEDHGFLIFQTTRISLDTFRGFSIYHAQLPIIVVNGSDDPLAKAFTLFHEFAHLIDRKNGLCALADNVTEEAAANSFSAHFLMPEKLVRQAYVASEQPMRSVEKVAQKLKVSNLAAAIRLRNLQLISEQELTQIQAIVAAAWKTSRDEQKKIPGFAPAWRIKYRDLGNTYIGAIAHALETHQIDAMDATYLLNAKWPMAEQILSEYSRKRPAA